MPKNATNLYLDIEIYSEETKFYVPYYVYGRDRRVKALVCLLARPLSPLIAGASPVSHARARELVGTQWHHRTTAAMDRWMDKTRRNKEFDQFDELFLWGVEGWQ